MHMRFWSLIFIIIFSASFISCSNGDVIFDCYYINWAGDYRLEGFYIDRNGNIYKYNRNGNPWLPESAQVGIPEPNEDELLNKFQNKKIIGNVDMTTLHDKINLISDTTSGTITRKPRGADMGARGCVAYKFDNSNKRYKTIQLGSSCDWDIENSSTSARLLLNWLSGFWELTK